MRTFRTLPLTFFVALPLAALPNAQTTHTVNLSGFSFSTPDLTIQVGDTVEWVWVSGFHSVNSGLNGVFDGLFSSGPPVFAPNTFSVTFDQAFLDANPVPGKVYDYFCSVHVALGMTGTVTVQVPSGLVPRNGGTNPASLNSTGGPILGTTLAVSVDLTTTGHDFALLFGFDAPFDFTLGGGQTLLCLDLFGSGEILGQTTQPGPTALFSIPIPNNPSLCGFSFCMQSIQFGGAVPFALSDALDATIGSF